MISASSFSAFHNNNHSFYNGSNNNGFGGSRESLVPPSTSELVVIKLKQVISYSLDHFLLDNAIFFAERLQASVSSLTTPNISSYKQEAAFILATCYYHKRQFKQAYTVLQDCKSAPCRFLFAKCCEELFLFSEGESALLSLIPKDINSKSSITNRKGSSSLWNDSANPQMPDLAAIFCLLGRLCRRSNRVSQAIEHFQMALNLNPMLWEAYEELCIQGVNVDANRHFNVEQISPFYPWATFFLNDSNSVSSSSSSSSSGRNSGSNSNRNNGVEDNMNSTAIFNSTNTENVPSSRNSISASPLGITTSAGSVHASSNNSLASALGKNSSTKTTIPVKSSSSLREPPRKVRILT